MVKDVFTGEVVEEYELVKYYYAGNYSKLLDKTYTYNYKRTKDDNVRLEPYSKLFTLTSSQDNFNNKKFSII